jgi:riboflavin biosynthesis pyrimidine reductase
VTSIDGRIAISRSGGRGLEIPGATANERDWRLYQELAAQADLIISSGRYLRQWDAGQGQEILQIDDPLFADLGEWRQSQDSPPQPDIAIISRSLRFPIPSALTSNDRKIIIFTTIQADPGRVEEIQTAGGQVFVAGEQRVDGSRLVESIKELGYQTVYSSAGPKVLHMLLAGGALSRLYLTHANRLLGGDPYSSMVEGSLFEPAVDLQLHTLYHDPHALDGLGQILIAYNF